MSAVLNGDGGIRYNAHGVFWGQEVCHDGPSHVLLPILTS